MFQDWPLYVAAATVYLLVARQLWVAGNAKVSRDRHAALRDRAAWLDSMNERVYRATIRDEMERNRRGDLALVGDVIRATFGDEAASL